MVAIIFKLSCILCWLYEENSVVSYVICCKGKGENERIDLNLCNIQIPIMMQLPQITASLIGH